MSNKLGTIKTKSHTKNKCLKRDVDTSVEKLVEPEKQCPDCDGESEVIHTEDGEKICGCCGLIIDDTVISQTPVNRLNETQITSQYTRHDKGLTTKISWKGSDGKGNVLSFSKKKKLGRLRSLQKKQNAKDSTEKNLRQAYGEISRINSALGLPDTIKKQSCVLYKKAVKNNFLKGRSIDGVSAATIFIVCKINKLPRSLSEIESVSRVDRKKISRNKRKLSRELDLQIGISSPRDYLDRFCSRLDLDMHIQRISQRIIDETEEQGLVNGQAPTGVAAGAIYNASIIGNNKRSQKEVADACKVGLLTVRRQKRRQQEVLDLDLKN